MTTLRPLILLVLLWGAELSFTTLASAQSLMYSETMVGNTIYCPGDQQYDNWTIFRSQLDTIVFDFTKVTIKGSGDTIGRSCTVFAKVNDLAAALKSGQTVGKLCGGFGWRVNASCDYGCTIIGDGIEFNATNNDCECNTVGYTIRPCLGWQNWGGVGTRTCATPPTQTLTAIFEYDSCDMSSSIQGTSVLNCGDTAVLWVPGGFPVIWSTGDTSEQIQFLTTKDTLITVTISLPCDTITDSLNLKVIGVENATIIGVDTICYLDSISLSATPGYNYLWSTGDTVQYIEVHPEWDSLYSVQIFNNCDIDTVFQLVSVVPSDTIIDTVSICADAQIFLEGAWRNTAGSYYDTLSNFFGCDSLVTTVLIVNPIPIVSLGLDSTLCNNGMAIFDAGNFGSTFIWQDSSTSQTYQLNLDSALGAVWTTVTVTNSFGCSEFDQVKYSVVNCSDFNTNNVVIEELTWSGGHCDICGGATGNYSCNPPWTGSVNWGPRSFTDNIPPGNSVVNVMVWLYWSGTNTTLTASLNGIEIGTTQNGNNGNCGGCVFSSLVYGGLDSCKIGFGPYNYGGLNTLSLVNSADLTCISLARVFLEYAPDSLVTKMSNVLTGPSCNGSSDGGIDLTIVQGRTPLTFLWSEGSETEDISSVSAGEYTVTFIDSTGCLRNWPFVLSEPSPITQIISTVGATCDSSNGFANVNVTGGKPPYTYQWDDPFLQTADTAFALSAGVYTVTVEDSSACAVVGTVTISDSTGPVLSIDSILDVTCHGGNDGQAFTSASGGTTPYTYIWNDPAGQTNAGAVGLATGSKVVMVTDSIGCKGGMVATINEPPADITSSSTTMCLGDSILLGGSYQFDAGVFADSLLSISGCDSVVYTVVTILPTYFISSTAAMCNGDSIYIGGAYRFTPGTYWDSLQSLIGCDSIISTVLSGFPTYSIQDSQIVACSGDSVLIYGDFRLQAGIYVDSSSSINGCDSIRYTILVIDSPSYTIDAPINLCSGDSVLVYAKFESVAGTYYDSLTSTNGCDSVHSLTLLVNPTFNNNDPPVDICSGDSMLIYGTYQSIAGVYFDSLVASNGCDSVRSTTLSVFTTYNVADPEVSLCQGDSALIYGYYESNSGIYWDSLITMLGCDSVRSTELVLKPIYNIADSVVTVCQGDSTMIYGIYRASAGIYYNNVLTSYGCDSIHSTELEVSFYSIIDPPVAICSGDSILVYGSYRFNSGVYYDSLTTMNGCDSIRSTELTANPSYTTVTANQIICAGDSTLIFGVYRKNTEIFYDTAITIMGCDSVTITSLIVVQQFNDSLSIQVCNGDSIYIQGSWQKTSGTYIDSLTSIYGCDSVHTTELTVGLHYNIIDLPNAICVGDSMLIYGVYQNVSGIYYDSLSTDIGCDSIHSMTLTVGSNYSINDPDITICSGDSVVIYGVYTKVDGVYFDSLVTVSGCDSVHSTVLTIQPSYIIVTPDELICAGDSIIIFGTTQTTAGTYYDSLITVESCDSVIKTTLLVNQLPSVSFSGLDSVYCSIDAVVTLVGAPDGGEFSGTGGVVGNQFFPTTGANIYIVSYSYTDSLGCSKSDSISVTVEECIGVTEYSNIQHLIVYPNPNTGKFTIEASIVRTADLELKVINSLGQNIFIKKVAQVGGVYAHSFDLGRYGPGVYTVILSTDDGDVRRQVIIE